MTGQKPVIPGLTVSTRIIAKQRNGPTDLVQLVFTKNYPRFETLDRNEWMQ
jgi:replicative DNA helicase